MQKRHAGKVCASIALIATGMHGCQQDGDAETDNDSTNKLPSDEWIMAKAYDPTYRVPERFFVDDRADTPRSYSVYHVLDWSGTYERCADDFDTAFQWDSEDHDSRSVTGVYVGSIENDRYFEFVRELSFEDDVGNAAALTSPEFSRVFKCSYVRRDGVDRGLRNGYAGTLGAQPVTMETIRNLSEYLWQFEFFWPATAGVLETYSTESTDQVAHTLRLVTLSKQGNGQCDRVEVIDWTFNADRADGTIEKRFERRHQFEARLLDGQPEKCGS